MFEHTGNINETGKAPGPMELTFSIKGQQTTGCRPNVLSLPLSCAWVSLSRVTLGATLENGIFQLDRKETDSPTVNEKQNSIELSCSPFRSMDTHTGFWMAGDVRTHWVT